jgi:hypothetical protein
MRFVATLGATTLGQATATAWAAVGIEPAAAATLA